MARRTPAEAVKAALDRLLDQRIAAAGRLAKLDEEITEIQAMLGIVVPAPQAAQPAPAAPGRPLMAGEGPRAPVDPNAPKKTLQQMMQEAAANPAPPGLPPEERPPFQELTQDAVLSTDGLEHLAPNDTMGAGRIM